jgi:hypothetical protein
LLRFVGPKPPKRKGGVLIDPTHPPPPPPPPDGAIRRYDLSDEEPDPLPDTQDDQGPFEAPGRCDHNASARSRRWITSSY